MLIVAMATITPSYPQDNSKVRVFFEKVYLHTDRDLYFSGEDIWYKAYLLNGQVNQLLNTSNNLYVELITPDAAIVDRKVIRLEEGLGYGDIRLSDSISAGTYRLRAYTNWMKNFGDNFVFEKRIEVSNDHAKLPKGGRVAPAKSFVAINDTGQKNILRFFPEGGSMLEGVAGIVAFKTEASNGRGGKVRAVVISNTGDTITSLESNDQGIGRFLLKPEAGLKYLVKGVINGKTAFTASLPEVLHTGFSIRTVNTDSAFVKVIISTNPATLADYKGHEMELRARHGGISYFSVRFPMNNPQAIAEIPKDKFPAGIAAISLADDKGRSHCERLVYIHSKNALKVNVSTTKPVYQSKERVVVTVKTTDLQNRPVKANLSLAAVDADIVREGRNNLMTYYMLESELRGEIENPRQYFDPANRDREKDLDNLLITQGWRDFIWKRMRDTSIVIKNRNETGFTISGRVTEKSSTKPVVGANVTLFASGSKGDKLFAATTNAEGRYYFDNINFDGNKVIKLVSTDSKAKKVGRLVIDSLYSPPFAINVLPAYKTESVLSIKFKTEAAKRKVAMDKFSLSDTIALKEVNVKGSKTLTIFGDVLTSFGYPDQNFVIGPKDYDYNSLTHYLMTNVNGALNPEDATADGVEFLSDGKRVRPIFIVNKRQDLFDRMDYYTLQMDQIEKITVRHMLGSTKMGLDSLSGMSTVKPGAHVYLIYLTLKPTAFEKKEFSLLNTSVNGYYQQRIFYSPVYPSAKSSTKTDLRTTIYWNPMVKTDENGLGTLYFYNADPKTKIRVEVEGVSENGVPGVGSATYEVK